MNTVLIDCLDSFCSAYVDDEWYLTLNFKNSALELRKFHEQNPDEAGPPVRLNHWIRCVEEDKFDENHPDNDKP
jgi:hypothetical protein